MGTLLTLYKTDLDKGREYLYDHMSVFSNVRHTEILRNNAKDIYNDTYMVIDDMIQKSIEKGYDERQIYQYIKKRVWGELTNRKIKYGKFTSEHLDEINESEDTGETPLDNLNSEVVLDMLHDKIFLMEDPYKTILLLTHFVTPKKSLKQIGLLLGLNETKVSIDYQKGIDILRSMIEDEDIYKS